ncbi:MAG TPA: hypothetical protein VMW76_03170 [Bacteroidales bacterium]|nr:hypothetical protein [Bacteroidales bacterium]
MKKNLTLYLPYLLLVLIMLAGYLIRTLTGLNHPAVSTVYSSLPVIVLVVLSGSICIWLSQKIGLPGTWDRSLSIKNRMLVPAGLGLSIALIMIILSTIEHIHIPVINMPQAIAVYISMGILSEIFFHFIPLVLLLWLVRKISSSGTESSAAFWVIAFVIALIESLLQSYSLVKTGAVDSLLPVIFFLELMLVANIISLVLIRRNGLGPAIIYRITGWLFWYIIWMNWLHR